MRPDRFLSSNDQPPCRKYRDYCTCTDHTEHHNKLFVVILAGMARAQMVWEERSSTTDYPHGFDVLHIQEPPVKGQEPAVPLEKVLVVKVINLFKSWGKLSFHLPGAGSTGWVIPLLGLGLVSTAPITLHIVFTARTIEHY